MPVYYFMLAFILIFIVPAKGAKATAKDGEKPFSFVVLGRVATFDHKKTNNLFDELLAEVRKLDPDLIFLTGAQNCEFNNPEIGIERIEPKTAYQWSSLDTELRKLGIPVHRVPGNRHATYAGTGDFSPERYNGLSQTVRYRGSLFILLSSETVAKADGVVSSPYSRPNRLSASQIDFIRRKLSVGKSHDHVFLFMQHLLWWSDEYPWWREVHPLLVGRNVRAVFSGELGPIKFLHTRRDLIDYIQPGIEQLYAIENPHAVEWLCNSEGSRLLARQFDNFLYVTVDGPQVNIKVETVGAISSGKFSPQRFRDVHGDVGYRVKMPEKSLVARVWNIIGTPWRLTVLALVMGICFLSGVAAGMVWNRRNAG